ncbi:MAG TPA: hypothetical protein PLB01_09795 [Thermoanaerobaculia bacterium]|nr:hypothetical protein [Thermoanaerobaculia bacterium]
MRHVLGVAALAVLAAAAALVLTRRLPAPASPRPAAENAGARSGLPTPAERRAIDAAIDAAAAAPPKLTLRPAVDADATDTDEHRDLDAVYGVYHPYFTRGDLDGDGRPDFVQAFVEKGRSGLWFHVAVFFGKADGTFGGPVWVERAISLADGDVTVERSLVVITPDLAGDATRRWRWEPAEHVFVDPDKEPRPVVTDDDVPDETPEQKPRARI